MQRNYKKHWLAKLNAHQVRKIRLLLGAGWSQDRVARKYKVSQPTIHNIVVGRTYRRVV